MADLKKYYRLPGLTVFLPTKGKYLPANSIRLNAEGGINVFPMVMADEMMLKNPDALMSGSAVQSLFESCVPDIGNPAEISSPDIDVLLLAIRVATYGRIMELETTCPSCERDLTFDCDLPAMLQNVKDCSFENVIRLSEDIIVEVRPYNVSDLSFMSRRIFEEERRLQQIEATEELTPEQRQVQRNLLFKRMSALQSEMLANTIMGVTTPDGIVQGREAMEEFLANVPSPWVKKIDAAQKEINLGGLDKSIEAKCEHCAHEWRTAVDFDPTSFFDHNSSE